MTQARGKPDDIERILKELPETIRETIKKLGHPGRLVVNVHHDSDEAKKIEITGEYNLKPI